MRKVLYISIFFVIFGILGIRIYSISSAENLINPLPSVLPIVEEKLLVKDYATLTFAGDVMLDRGVKGNVIKNFNNDYSKLFENVDIFKNDDISFLNLEGPVSNLGRKVGSIYSFRMPVETIPTLKNTGVDIVSFANNHVGDYTGLAFKDTLDRLKENDIANWMKASIENPGILLASDPDIKEIVTNAKINSDILVVSFHWGEEYKNYNLNQEYLAKKVIDSGADIVIGHHPHVPQDIAYYKGKPIIYSLGNFVFDQYFSPETMSGLVVQIEVKKDGAIQKLTKYKSTQNEKYQIESISEIK